MEQKNNFQHFQRHDSIHMKHATQVMTISFSTLIYLFFVIIELICMVSNNLTESLIKKFINMESCHF
jgi:hypothetical protein